MKLFKSALLIVSLAFPFLAALASVSPDSLPTIEVFKSATCGCCTKWVSYLEESGFKVKSRNVKSLAQYKEKASIPAGMGSCHTAFVNGYVVEGHVPAADIKRMLSEQADITGLIVPGMPMGSPGMEYGGHKDAYQTMSYTRDGKVSIYARH